MEFVISLDYFAKSLSSSDKVTKLETNLPVSVDITEQQQN